MRLAIIAGHGLIGPGHQDPGGTGPAGAEADWTADFAEHLSIALRAMNHEVGVETLGSSLDRSADADGIRPDLILYLHGDEGQGGVFHFPGSPLGLRYATLLCHELVQVLPTLQVHSASVGGYPRANALLARTQAPAVLLELVDERKADAVHHLLDQRDAVVAAIVTALTLH